MIRPLLSSLGDHITLQRNGGSIMPVPVGGGPNGTRSGIDPERAGGGMEISKGVVGGGTTARSVRGVHSGEERHILSETCRSFSLYDFGTYRRLWYAFLIVSSGCMKSFVCLRDVPGVGSGSHSAPTLVLCPGVKRNSSAHTCLAEAIPQAFGTPHSREPS